MTIPTAPPRRIRIGTTSILVRIRHVLTGMIIGRRPRIGRVNPGMVREDGTTIRAAGQVMARVGDKANGNRAMAPAGDQVNLASRDRVVLVDVLGRVAVRVSPVSPVNLGRVAVRGSPASRSSLVSPVNLGRVAVRGSPASRSSLVSPVNLDRVAVRANPVSPVNLGRVAVRGSPASRSNPVSPVNLGRVAVRGSPASRSSPVSPVNLGRVAARGSPANPVLAPVRVSRAWASPVSRHSSPLGRRAPLLRHKSRSRDNRHSRDSRDSRLIRKGLVLPNRFGANLLP